MAKKILAVVGIIIVLFLIVVVMQPSEFKVERSAVIDAPPKVVFEQFNNFKNWEAWSPWAKMDPQAKNTYEGPAAGEGAMLAWEGDKSGSGKMTIVESQPPKHIKIKLEFFKPMAGVSDTLFAFTPEGKGTKVTWTMSGKNDFMGKMFCLFMNMDKMVGGDFEKGLASVKEIAESKK